MDKFNFFLPLSKIEKTDDGARIVTGYASTPTKDLDGEIISLDAVRKALPSYMDWRNIRQMHQPIAVGVAKEANVDDKGLYITGRIVDANAIKLLDEEVLKGFSVGGKKLAKKGDTITDIDLLEISLVDRPANPDCRIDAIKGVMKDITLWGAIPEPVEGDGWFRKTIDRLIGLVEESADVPRKPVTFRVPYIDDPGEQEYAKLCKREFSDKERSDAEASGEAMPGGGYPIKSKTDLHNAIQAFGRAKNPDATRAHIIARAKALGATDSLPADWEGSTKKENTVNPALLNMVKSMPGVFGLAEVLPHANVISTFMKTLAETPVESRAADRIGKGMHTMSDLVCAFECMRGAQRRLLREAAIEKDGEDEALCHRLGQLASELAAVISQKAEHEGSEALYLTDADDLSYYTYNGDVPMTLNANASDLAKRRASAHNAHLAKVAHHLAQAGMHHAKGMGFLQKCSGMFGKAVQSGDASELLKGEDAAKHLAKANEHFSAASDHMEMAHHHLAKSQAEPPKGDESHIGEGTADVTAAGLTANTGGVSSVALTHMTEGDVPWYDADQPYAQVKAAAAGISKADVEAIVKAAVGEAVAKVEKTSLERENTMLKGLLSRTPANTARPQLFAVDKGVAITGNADAHSDAQVLFEGVSEFAESEDPNAIMKAGARAISNMIRNPGRFAKSVFDPGFKGKAGLRQ